MSAKRIGISVLAVSGMLNGAVLAQAANGQSSGGQQPANPSSSQNAAEGAGGAGSQGKSSQGSDQQQQQTPEGWILVQERVIVLTANEPQNHFLRAQQHLAQGNAKAAAAEARVGAAYLEMQAARSRGAADQKLSDAATALRQQASQIAQAGGDAQKQQEQLKQSFASANAALAAHFKSLAQRSLQSQRNVMAGYDLNAAAASLAAAFAWSGTQPQQEASTAIRDAQQAAAQLMTPGAGAQQQGGQSAQAGQAEDQAQTASAQIDQKGGQAPANVSQAIDKLGNAIQQSSSSFQTGNKGDKSQGGQKSQSDQQGQSGSSAQ